jgi:tetratricopeptide (TPR) repeat protein/DNA-binding XRE family transcriptional regulator
MSGHSHPRKQPRLTREWNSTPSTPGELALTVRLLRWLPNWSQQELAARSGVAKSGICRYERGKQPPSPRTLARLCDAVGVPVATVDHVLRPALRQLLAAREGVTPAETHTSDAGAWADELLRALAAILRPAIEMVIEDVLASEAGPWGRDRPPSEADRREAPELWAVLLESSKSERDLLLEESREYWSWAVCELACAETLEAAPHSADRALELAELAVRIAELAPGEDLWSRRIQGYAEAHLGNALRVHGKLQGSEEAFRRALPLWKAGAPGDPGLLNEARVLGLEASLRLAQQRSAEALELLNRALAVDHPEESRYLLVNRARALEQLGDYAGAVAALRQAVPLLDERQEPRQLWVVHFTLLSNLCHIHRFAEAEALLPDVQTQAERLGQGLDLVRTLWLQGWIAAGQGRREEAIQDLEQVRREFTAQEIPFDAALVTLQLATLYLEDGRTAEVRELALTLAWIFSAEGMHPQGLAALRLFREAAEQEAVTVEVARRLSDYLYRAQRNPELPFEA